MEESFMVTSENEQRQLRAAKNQSLFRQVNEQIERIGEKVGSSPRELVDFICECTNQDCTGRVAMTRSEYESLRRIPTHFAVKPGHIVPEVEATVSMNERYEVVVKIEAAGEEAIKRDPRSPKPAASSRPSTA
jgi:hypothetical protein